MDNATGVYIALTADYSKSAVGIRENLKSRNYTPQGKASEPPNHKKTRTSQSQEKRSEPFDHEEDLESENLEDLHEDETSTKSTQQSTKPTPARAFVAKIIIHERRRDQSNHSSIKPTPLTNGGPAKTIT